MAIRKKGITHRQPMTTKKTLKKKTINKKVDVDNQRAAIIKQINVLLKELA